MFISRLLSLVVGGLYVLTMLVAYLAGAFDGQTQEEVVKGIFGLLGWLVLSLGCIWYGDELGEGLIGAKFGLISSPSAGWAVIFMGWVLLLLPIIIGVIGAVIG